MLAAIVCGYILVAMSVAWADPAMEQIEAWGFPVGEALIYRVYWGAIPVGEAVVKTGWKDGSEGDLLHLQLSVTSNRAIAAIYPVSIKLQSIVRASDFLPVRHLQNRREGRRRKRLAFVFDHAAGEAIRHDLATDQERVIALEGQTRDVFTLMYYLRRYPYELESKTRHRFLSDRRVHDLWISVGAEETYVTRLLEDRIPVVTVEPDVAIDEIFDRKGRVEVEISRDPRQLMLHMRANVRIGSIRVVLQEVRGPGTDGWGLLSNGE